MNAQASAAVGTGRLRRLSQTLNSLKRLLRPKHEHEVLALSEVVEDGIVALEIGANYAQYSRVLSKLVGEAGHVYAFEPAQITYECLLRNCRVLRLRNVTTRRLALSDSAGEMRLHTPIKPTGVFGVAQASLAPDPELGVVSERIAVDTVDNFSAEHRLARIGFIRCDVEGAEMNVFRGAQRVLREDRPNLLIEVHPEMITRFGFSVPDLQALLRGLGYRFFRFEAHRWTPALADLPRGNVFCLPE